MSRSQRSAGKGQIRQQMSRKRQRGGSRGGIDDGTVWYFAVLIGGLELAAAMDASDLPAEAMDRHP
jgi:heme O synthase-like polyprenyltransferase